jgi:hypothetical protein
MYSANARADDGQKRTDSRIASLENSVTRIMEVFKVRVHYSYDRDAYFPAYWRSAPTSAEGRQIELDEAARTIPVIEAFLAKYSTHVIAANLRDIFLLKRLSAYGQPFGGSAGRSSVYITNDGESSGATARSLEGTMHSEFSSILYRRYPFPAKEWSAINGSDWVYLGYGDNHDLMSRDDLFERREDLLRKGFLNVYAQASMEEDFNMYVYELCAYPSETLRAAAEHNKIWQKIQLVIRYYNSIDPAFRFAGEPEPRNASKAESPAQTGRAGGGLPQGQTTLPDLPDDVFAHRQQELFVLMVPGRSPVTITGGTKIKITGPRTFSTTEAGPVTITVGPASDHD